MTMGGFQSLWWTRRWMWERARFIVDGWMDGGVRSIIVSHSCTMNAFPNYFIIVSHNNILPVIPPSIPCLLLVCWVGVGEGEGSVDSFVDSGAGRTLLAFAPSPELGVAKQGQPGGRGESEDASLTTRTWHFHKQFQWRFRSDDEEWSYYFYHRLWRFSTNQR